MQTCFGYCFRQGKVRYHHPVQPKIIDHHYQWTVRSGELIATQVEKSQIGEELCTLAKTRLPVSIADLHPDSVQGTLLPIINN
mgnify:FL=1